MILDTRAIVSNLMNYPLDCIHCGERLAAEPEKGTGFRFIRCLACGTRNILAEHPLSSPEPDTEDLFIGYIDAHA
jgi:DNA-directed RNA polymerase subunit RPC12/RpoP